MPELAAYLFLLALLLTGVLTPFAIRCGVRLGVLDHPGSRKIHHSPIPLTGGWAIFTVLSVILWCHLLFAVAIRYRPMADLFPESLQHYIELAPNLILKIAPVYAGAVVVFILGLVDDVRGMSVRSRLIYQMLLATALVAAGVRPSLGFLPSWMAASLGVIWIVGITNAFNFLDGLDGLSSGVALVATLSLLTIMAIGAQPDMAFFLATMAGTLLGFLRYNFQPARIFLGSSGSLLIGYLLGVTTLLVTYRLRPGDNWLVPVLTPVFILAIPIYDTSSVVLIRLIQKRPIAIGDQSHFHHRLLRIGFTPREVVVFVCLIAGAIALSAVRLITAGFRTSLLIFAQILGIFMILVLAERVAARARSALLLRRRMREERLRPETHSEVSSERKN